MKIDKSLMSGSTTLLILSLLAGEEMYGYQMIVELARRSNKTFELREGPTAERESITASPGRVGGPWRRKRRPGNTLRSRWTLW